MQKKIITFFLALYIPYFVILFPAKIKAQENIPQETELDSSSEPEKSPSLTIERASLATAIIDREPEGISSTFSKDIDKIYFFTHVRGTQEPTIISHRWYFEGTLMAEVELPVKSMSWRTYSSKKIVPSWIGNWLVEAVDAEGRVLEALPFEISN